MLGKIIITEGKGATQRLLGEVNKSTQDIGRDRRGREGQEVLLSPTATPPLIKEQEERKRMDLILCTYFVIFNRKLRLKASFL